MVPRWRDEARPPAGVTVLHSPLERVLGDRQCSAQGCSARTGVPCYHVDSKGRPCPTAWCPAHRLVVRGELLCPLHGAAAHGPRFEHGDGTVHEADSPLPATVAGVGRLVEEDLTARLLAIAAGRGHVVVGDPVRRLAIGILRDRCWEIAWKVCSTDGLAVKVALQLFEDTPSTLLANVNARTVATLPAPERALGADLQPEEAADMAMELLGPIEDALDRWLAENPPERRIVGRRAPGVPARPVPPQLTVLSGRPDPA